ncbi:uncharacterized protein LOC143297291 [Babylonia areolata]|uniref:uncharacterized protein LOC143297291 n=1 Tax=Babylonia areolata TaxID=304850 RepID=UPI003FD2F9A4
MCGTASGWAKMSFVCLLVGMALHIAGWATNNWMTYETSGSVLEVDVGLWRQRSCTNGNCEVTAVQSQYETDDFNAVRALETIVFCVVVFATILLAVYVFFEGVRRQSVAIVLMVLCFLAGTVSLVGMIVWLATLPSPFIVSYSLGLTVLAFLLVYIAGTLLIPDVFEPMDYYTRSRSDLVTPTYTPPGRRGMITPISYNNKW